VQLLHSSLVESCSYSLDVPHSFLRTIYAEEVAVPQQAEADIDLNASSNEPPLAHAIMVDGKTSSGNAAPDAAGTTTTTTYTVPAPGGSTPAGGVPASIGYLTRSPMTITCPHCAVTAVTRPRTQIDCITILIVVLLLLLFWPLFWLPFVIPVSANESYGNQRLYSLH
jgi:hypothetical protein